MDVGTGGSSARHRHHPRTQFRTGHDRAHAAEDLGFVATTVFGGAERPWVPSYTDALTGALLVLTDARELRVAAVARRGLGPPDASSTYRPGVKLDRFVRARDRRCRFPGCRNRVHDVHHITHWAAGGTTAVDNGCLLCTVHHQHVHERGWTVTGNPNATLTFTSPTGFALTSPLPAAAPRHPVAA